MLRSSDKKCANEARIDYKYPGDYFGECALLEGTLRNATVVARKQNTECIVLDATMFKALVGPLSEIHARSESTLCSCLLVAVPLFSQLNAGARTLLQQHLPEESFKAGEYLFYQGAQCDTSSIDTMHKVKARMSRSDPLHRYQATLLLLLI